MFETSRRRMLRALGFGGAVSVVGCANAPAAREQGQASTGTPVAQQVDVG